MEKKFESNGYEQDLQAIKEFSTIKFKKNSLPHVFLLKEEFAKYWENDKEMQDYCLETTSNCILTSFGGLVIFDKPNIETSFRYSDIGQGQSFEEANEQEANFGEKQFLINNLADMREVLNLFEGKKNIPTKRQSICILQENTAISIQCFFLMSTKQKSKLGGLAI